MGKINAAWHRANRVPRNATLDQRIAWHVAHATHCGCRPIDGKLAEAMKRRGMAIPVYGDRAGPNGSRTTPALRPGSENRRSR